MRKYFLECRSIEDVKKEYRRLAALLHPDMNKDRDTTAEFQEMANDYEIAFQKWKNVFVNVKGETFEKENTEVPGEFKDIIDRIIHFEGIKIEVIGTWIWISGNSFLYRESLKQMGFSWCSKKKAWSYHKEAFKKKSRNELTMEELRNLYGTAEIDTEKVERIS